LYQRAPRMLDELSIARADGRFGRLLAQWARTDVLVVDDWLLRPLNPDQAADTLEVLEDRVGLRRGCAEITFTKLHVCCSPA
jgi:DNA replication protein DnaC